MIGKRFGRFEIVEKLGMGAMGVVYRARDLQLERDVAVKFLPARFSADAERLARFKREARAASALNHPNIVTIHDVGLDEGLPYMVMELVPGRPLRERVGAGALATRELLELGTQLAEGLACAHAAGIVHRDLKPENVVVTPDGVVKILDFGLAKAASPESGVPLDGDTHSLRFGASADSQLPSASTDPGVVLGTAGYMSPEQAAGRSLDFRSDQFALGCLLYEMGTGRRAFERATAVQTMASILDDEPAPAGTLNPALPAPLRWIIARCLSKDPRQRYDSTQDLARELKTIRDHLGETSGSQPAPVSSGSGAAAGRANPRFERWWTLLAAGVALVALAGAVRGPLLRALGREPLPDERHVVVLPFDSDTQDAPALAFADGLADTLSSRLAQLGGRQGSLWVVPSAEVRRAGVSTAGAARRVFGATLAVIGRLHRTGARLQLDAQLIDARQERALRNISFSTLASEPTRIEDEAIAHLARLLDADPGPEQARARPSPPVPASAYDAYLEGRGFLQRYEDPARLDQAISALQHAAEIDPRYALAYAGLGEAYWRRYEQTKRPEFVELAQKACRRALELNDLLAQVHVTLGLLHLGTGKASEAEGELRRALALDPGNADAVLHHARTLAHLERVEAAQAEYERAIGLRPGYWAGYNSLAAFQVTRGRYADAEASFRRALAVAPDNPRPHYNLGGLYQKMGRYQDAQRALEESLRLAPSARAYSNLGALQFALGRYAEAARTFERAAALEPANYQLRYNLAGAYYWAEGLREKAAPMYVEALRLGREQLPVNEQDAMLVAILADCHAMLDHGREARELAGRALELGPRDADVHYRIASVHERLGARDQALSELRAAVKLGYSWDELLRTPDLAALRGDARFQQLRSEGSS